ncbi:alginate O-acetyltransferase AlgX-related protein [Clostridium botulinum]|uniref:alginate O-acetyltransferase AlgX-related protein n=1 Tax=Clostridium botulinum TaxID=1491 RepID=UPI000D128668|nr:alginate O-acetyltransferase [Clostridium botulinum]AVQ45625.1 alginate O-acetyltransferase [Clostridium botulinum]AVQ49564.1 alginate O-acetyltransferase [Clostridium botulinum]
MKKIHFFRIILFLFIIAFPIFSMNLKNNQVSDIDNRKLIELSEIFSEGNIIPNIENYIGDRIGFRTQMVNVYTKAMDILFDEMIHPSYEYGKDGYIFPKLKENETDKEFQEVYSDFILNFQNYCIDRGIKFLYATEPIKTEVYSEFLPDGYNYNNENLEYFLSLLKDKNVNYIYTGEALIDAKSSKQVFDKKYDANHWNETGAIVGISSILDRLNDLDSRVGKFDINEFEAVEYTSTTLPVSHFTINEKTTHYNLKKDNSLSITDFRNEIKQSKKFTYFANYKNPNNKDAPKILIFAGSYFQERDKFLTENFSEVIRIHNYHNVIDYDYYINVFNPDIVLFESTESTHSDYYFPLDKMKNSTYNKEFKYYSNLSESKFAYIKESTFKKSDTNLMSFSIPIEGEKLSYAYADISNRILDCRVKQVNGKQEVEFSIPTSEIENLSKFSLYLISEDESRIAKLPCNLN